LVSRDNDLLDLMKDATFRQRCPDLMILDPVPFLASIASKEQSEQASAQPSEQTLEGSSEHDLSAKPEASDDSRGNVP
jgi:hypothetical protein